MKKFFNILFLVILFIASFIAFFPKEKLYYYGQKKLLPYNIMVQSKAIQSEPFSLDIQQSSIFLSGSKIATLQHCTISLLGIHCKNIEAIGTFKSTIPTFKQIDIFYKPGVFATINGDFGTITATLDIKEKKIIFKAKIEQAVKNRYKILFATFKKRGDIYVYEITL